MLLRLAQQPLSHQSSPPTRFLHCIPLFHSLPLILLSWLLSPLSLSLSLSFSFSLSVIPSHRRKGVTVTIFWMMLNVWFAPFTAFPVPVSKGRVARRKSCLQEPSLASVRAAFILRMAGGWNSVVTNGSERERRGGAGTSLRAVLFSTKYNTRYTCKSVSPLSLKRCRVEGVQLGVFGYIYS